jgi:hypothetical protein
LPMFDLDLPYGGGFTISIFNRAGWNWHHPARRGAISGWSRSPAVVHVRPQSPLRCYVAPCYFRALAFGFCLLDLINFIWIFEIFHFLHLCTRSRKEVKRKLWWECL